MKEIKLYLDELARDALTEAVGDNDHIITWYREYLSPKGRPHGEDGYEELTYFLTEQALIRLLVTPTSIHTNTYLKTAINTIERVYELTSGNSKTLNSVKIRLTGSDRNLILKKPVAIDLDNYGQYMRLTNLLK